MMASRSHDKRLVNRSLEEDDVKVQYFNSSVPLLFVLVSVGLTVVVMVSFVLANIDHSETPPAVCSDPCRLVMGESIPVNMTYPEGSPKHMSIFQVWRDMVRNANKTIDIAAFYLSLQSDDVPVKDPSSKEGQELFGEILNAGLKRGIKIRIVTDNGMGRKSNDTVILESKGAAEVRYMDMRRLEGGGVLHTKMWLIDGKDFTVGSANLDWRSLTEVKELIAAVYDCECYANDMAKLFEVYWEMGAPNATVPVYWPDSLSTKFNKDTPLQVSFNGTSSRSYLSSSPPDFCPTGRTVDIDAIIDVMDKAQEFIYISVMDYEPLLAYTLEPSYWPLIDDKMRSMAIDKQVKVRLMTSYWSHTHKEQTSFLQSLASLNNTGRVDIEVRRFVVPPTSHPIPFTRVNHCKFMVTDNTAYVGTSNWSEDYFTVTAGIGLIINSTETTDQGDASETFRDQLHAVFERDWNSDHAYPLVIAPQPPPV